MAGEKKTTGGGGRYVAAALVGAAVLALGGIGYVKKVRSDAATAEADAKKAQKAKGKKRLRYKTMADGSLILAADGDPEDSSIVYKEVDDALAEDAKDRLEMEAQHAEYVRQAEDTRKAIRFGEGTKLIDEEFVKGNRPNVRHEGPAPLIAMRGKPIQPDEVKGDPQDLPHVIFTGPRYNAYPGQPIEAVLEVRKGAPGSAHGEQRLPAAIKSASLARAEKDAFVPFADFPLNDEGRFGDAKAGDLVYAGALDVFKDSKNATLRGELRLTVVFNVQGSGETYTGTLDFPVNGAPQGKILGIVGDRNTGGGLELVFKVQANEAGIYILEGNISTSGGKPLIHVEHRTPIDAGTHEVTVPVCGAAFRETSADGPYVIDALFAEFVDEKANPPQLFMLEAPPGMKYTTKAYRGGEFSDASCASPAQQRALKTAEAEAADPNPSTRVVDKPDEIGDDKGGVTKVTGDKNVIPIRPLTGTPPAPAPTPPQ